MLEELILFQDQKNSHYVNFFLQVGSILLDNFHRELTQLVKVTSLNAKMKKVKTENT